MKNRINTLESIRNKGYKNHCYMDCDIDINQYRFCDIYYARILSIIML